MATKRWQDANKITKAHINAAAKKWKRNPSIFRFRESRIYDVYVAGEPYPPKAICAIAYNIATKKTLEPTDFVGAEDGFWHRILKNRGYSIVSKYSDAALVAKSEALLNLSDKELVAKAEETSSAKPLQKKTSTVSYVRSPYVRAAVLRRAKGICERCRKTAPFIKRTTGKPFLEVHHVLPLSHGGADDLSNTKALCPNCHREEHDILGVQEGGE